MDMTNLGTATGDANRAGFAAELFFKQLQPVQERSPLY